MNLIEIGKSAKAASKEMYLLKEITKNDTLLKIALEILNQTTIILQSNNMDIENAKETNMSVALLDRLLLTEERIKDMANGLQKLAILEDPIGKILEMNQRPNGLMIGKKVVPLGVIGIIYESRPNVTVDAFGLCFKTNNCVILRGGKEAIHTNTVLVKIIQQVLSENKLNPNLVQLIEDTSRETVNEFMKMNDYLDVLIPRGGQGLINNVIANSTIPVIQTGIGNCHVYIDKDAEVEMALAIAYNAKVQRPGVCNSCETIVVHKDIAAQFLPRLATLFESIVEVRADDNSLQYIPYGSKATTLDYETEFHDYIVSIITVDSFKEAVEHIQAYSTGHSEAIVTNNYTKAQLFLEMIDAAAVYVNASTRFTDGEQFGFGAEIGISTQKLHARGPMGLKELTTTKYIIYGNGQIRE